MNVIEVDGVNHQPHTVDQIDIFAGQRYSFVVSQGDLVTFEADPDIGLNSSLPTKQSTTTVSAGDLFSASTDLTDPVVI